MTAIDAFIDRAISMAQSEPHRLEVGDVAVHPSEEISAKLLRYEGAGAILLWPDGRTRGFPAHEVIDPNRVHDLAAALLRKAQGGPHA
jgi:hypothetical protein